MAGNNPFENNLEFDAKEHDIDMYEDFSDDMTRLPTYFNPKKVPDGYKYILARKTINNIEDKNNLMALERQGYRPVPPSRHPEFGQYSWSIENPGQQNVIEYNGLILLEIEEARYNKRLKDYEKTARERENATLQSKDVRGAPVWNQTSTRGSYDEIDKFGN